MKHTPKYSEFEKKVRQSFNDQRFMQLIGAKIVIVEPGFCEIHLPYKELLTQQDGYFHAGIVGTIADNAGGYAAFSLMTKEASVLSVEYKINLLSPAIGEKLIARGSVIKNGRTLTACSVEVFNFKKNEEKLCAVSQMTLISL